MSSGISSGTRTWTLYKNCKCSSSWSISPDLAPYRYGSLVLYKCQHFIPFHGWLVVHYMVISHFFTIGGPVGLSPLLAEWMMLPRTLLKHYWFICVGLRSWACGTCVRLSSLHHVNLRDQTLNMRACQQAPLPTEASCQPCRKYLSTSFCIDNVSTFLG